MPHSLSDKKGTYKSRVNASLEVVRKLLAAGADPTLADSNGYFPYHWAGWHMRPKDFVETLNPDKVT